MSPDRTLAASLPRGAYPGADSRRGLAWRIRKAFGLRRSFKIGNVRYKEVTTEPLRVALSKRGSGFKDYDVTIGPHGSGGRIRIRVTQQRSFADLVPPPTLPVCLRAERLLRPGMRALLVPCGTGFAAAMVSGRVAPSGSVVALDSDEAAIEFARLRYPIQNLSFEHGDLSDLAGETDGAFDAVLSIAVRENAMEANEVAELWRLVAPGGWLLIASRPSFDVPAAGASHTSQPQELADLITTVCAPPEVPTEVAAGTRTLPANIAVLGDATDGWSVVLARRADPLEHD